MALALAAPAGSLGLVNVSAGPASYPGFLLYSAQGYDKAAVAAFNAPHPCFVVTSNDNSTGHYSSRFRLMDKSLNGGH